MNPKSIIIIVAVFGVWFLLMAVFMLFFNKKKGTQEQFVNDNKQNAILHIYGEKS